MSESNVENERQVLQAEVPGANPEDYRTIALAHPLNSDDLGRLGLDPEAETRPGTLVSVYKDHARNLITAGYAQVDPEDKVAVQRVMDGEQSEPAQTPPPANDGEDTNRTRPEPTIPMAEDRDTPGDGSTGQDVVPAEEVAVKNDEKVVSDDPVAPVPVEGQQETQAKAPSGSAKTARPQR